MGKQDKLYQVSFLLEKLYDINKQLGGYCFIKNKLKNADNKFELLFIECKDKIMQIKQIQKVQKDKNQTKLSVQNITQKYQINNIINDCQKIIQQINKLLTNQAKQKDFCKQLFEFQLKKYKDLKKQVENIMQEYDIDPSIINLDDFEDQQKLAKQSERDYSSILDLSKQTKRIYRQEVNKNEQNCLQNIEKNNKIQEEIIVNIYEKAQNLQNKVIQIGEKQNQIDSQIANSNKNFQKTNAILDNQNQRMKNLLTKFRQPNKLCLDIILILFIIGLIGILWQMLK
ncbi:hypothetical protein ABPG74_021182 [Tetrahymena malaccensis]